ncbi:MAG: T9SS type A sorting domain-containing protein [Ignavibacteriaceae bacterium]
MKKYFYTVMLSLLFFSGYLEAQVKVWQPYIQFHTDGGVPCIYNPAEAYFIVPTAEGQQGSYDRFADGTNMIQYHFNLAQFQNIQNTHPLHLRCYLHAEFVVEVSSTPITDVNSGQIVAQYAPGPPWTTRLEDGSNDQWVDVPLDQYYAIGQTDLYLSFFDGKSDDGWGPDVFTVGLWYYDTENAGTTIDAAIANDGVFNINGDVSAWPSKTQWFSMQNGAAGITSIGNVTGLSASVGVGFDNDNIYFAANVTDNNVANSDSIIFYFGNYDLTDSLNNWGHMAFVGDSAVTGYRMRYEPDYRFVVTNINDTPTISETKLVGGTLSSDSKVTVTKNANGYVVQAQIAKTDLFVDGKANRRFAVDPNTFYPVAFKVVDGVSGGALITGGADVDNNPTSWGLKTNIFDKRTAVSTAVIGLVKSFTPGKDDLPYVLPEPYKGSGSDQDHRWADYKDTLGYHFDQAKIQAWAPGLQLYMNFHVGNEYVIDTSSSLTGSRGQIATWSTKMQEIHDMSNVTNIEIPLASSGDLYVWFTDGDTADGGWGPSLDQIKIYYKGVNADSNLVAFVPGGGDQTYLVADSGSGSDSQHRWADENSSFGYRFDLASLKPKAPANTTLYFNVNVGNEWKITVAKDSNAQQYPLDSWDPKGIQEVHDESNMAWHSYSLQPYIDSAWSHVVFFFHDGLPSDGGWGASVRYDNGKPGVKITYRQILAYYPFDSFVPSSPESASELRYLVEKPQGYTGSGVDDTHRWADETSAIAYAFNKEALLAADGGVNNIVFQVDVANEYVIWVNNVLDTSATSPNLKMVYQYNSNRNVMERSEGNRTTLEINLSNYFIAGWDTVYVLFTDGRPQDGWGPSLHRITLNAVKPAVVTGVKKENNTIPDKFALDQNYPNPFNPSTIISYDIPTQGKVVLKIYSILGQEVRTLVDDVQASGRYQITWNGDNNFGQKLASGIYFYRMLYNQQQIVKKMVLLK